METINLVWGNALLLLCVIIEILIIKFILKEKLPWKEIILNFNSGHILLWVFRGMEVAAYFYTVKFLSLGIVDGIPIWSQWVIAFVLWDFCFYWLHRTHHYFSVLWGVHVVHHEGEHFSLSLGIRNSWYSSLTSYPFFIIMAVIGIPVEMFILVSSTHYFIQFYNHNHLVKKSGWLEYIMVTPSHHRVHHGSNDPYIDKNFGGTFVFWDKFFGTFQREIADNPVEFGVHEPIHSNNPILINNIPILELIGFENLKKKMNKVSFSLPNLLLVSGALLLFVLLLFYIYYENSLAFEPKIVLFALVFLGTIGNGILSDGKWIGAFLWGGATIGLSFIMLINYPELLVGFKLCLLLAMIHGIATLFWLTKDKVLTESAQVKNI